MAIKFSIYVLALLFPIISYAQPADEKMLIKQVIEDYLKQENSVYHVTDIDFKENEAMADVAAKDLDNAQVCLKKTDGKWVVINIGTAFGPGDCD